MCRCLRIQLALCAKVRVDTTVFIWHVVRGRARALEAYEKREAARNDLIVFISRARPRKYWHKRDAPLGPASARARFDHNR